MERKCATLAKRVAICDWSVDGQDKPSVTRDCVAQRERYRALCSGVVLHEGEAEPDVDSKAITDAYREAAAARAGAVDGASASDDIFSHPIVAGVSAAAILGGAVCGVLAVQAATGFGASASSSSTTTSKTQRLMQARVYGQAGVIATVVGAVGLSKYLSSAKK